MEITAEQRKYYLDNKGSRCPFCGKMALEGDSVDVEAGVARQSITCAKCGKEWEDVYSLVDIVPSGF